MSLKSGSGTKENTAAAHDFHEIIRLAEAAYKRERERKREHSKNCGRFHDLDIMMPVIRRLSDNPETLTDVVDLAREYAQADLALMIIVVRRLCESADTCADAVDLAHEYGRVLEVVCRSNFDPKL